MNIIIRQKTETDLDRAYDMVKGAFQNIPPASGEVLPACELTKDALAGIRGTLKFSEEFFPES